MRVPPYLQPAAEPFLRQEIEKVRGRLDDEDPFDSVSKRRRASPRSRRFSASPGRRVSLRGLTKRVWSRRPGGSQRTAGGENLAEGMHPALRVLSRASSPAAELV